MILANIWQLQKNTLQLSFWEIINFLKKRGTYPIFWWFKNVCVNKLIAWREETEYISLPKDGDAALARDCLYHRLKVVTQCIERLRDIAQFWGTDSFLCQKVHGVRSYKGEPTFSGTTFKYNLMNFWKFKLILGYFKSL